MAWVSRLYLGTGVPEQTPPISIEAALPVGRPWFAARASYRPKGESPVASVVAARWPLATRKADSGGSWLSFSSFRAGLRGLPSRVF